jgi:Sulfotransferase family
MTATSLDGTAAIRDQAADHDDPARNAPVIILTYSHAGAEQLASLLDRHPDLACTTGTGILPLCEQAAATWRAVDGRPASPPSQLAETSTRNLVTSMITALLARHGKRRWCEIATAAPDAAGTFTRLFPGTRIICLYRACPDVVRAAVHASPWGLAGPEYAPFTTTYPASTIAALTAYWTTHTTSLLTFEQAHPGTCHRLRHEDLAADSFSCLPDFLRPHDPGLRPATWPHDEAADPACGAAGPGTDFPAGQVPSLLLERANGLMEKLGYQPMRPGTTPARSSR